MKEGTVVCIGIIVVTCMILAISFVDASHWSDPDIVKDMEGLDTSIARHSKLKSDPDYGMCIPRMGPSNATLGGCEWLRRKT